MKKLIFIFALISLTFAKENVNENYEFNQGWISVEGGEIYPFRDLVDAVYNTYYGGVGFRYSYLKNVDGLVSFSYSYFEPRPSEVPYDGVHQFSGKVGAEFYWPLIYPVVLGAGFVCNWTRADSDLDEKWNDAPGGSLLDNETEFGWFARANLVGWNFENYRVGLSVIWEELWTLPKRSNMLSVGVYVERRLW